MKTSRLAQQLAEEDAKRPPAIEPGNGQGNQLAPQGPRYEFYRPWYKRFLAKGCSHCGGEPSGWVQRQIQMPKRFLRTFLWVVNLVPRGASFVHVILSRRIDLDRYVERQESCATCPAAVIQLRVVRGAIREASYCGACQCPRWHLSRNAVRNRRLAWRCPLRRHIGSDPNAPFVGYLKRKQEIENEKMVDRGSDRSALGDRS